MGNYFQIYNKEKVQELLNNIKKFPIKTKMITNKIDIIETPSESYKIYGNLWNSLFGSPIIYYKKNLSSFLIYINSDYTKNYNLLEIRKSFANIKKKFIISEKIDNSIIASIAKTLFSDYYDDSLLAVNKVNIFNDERDEMIEFALNYKNENSRDYPQNIFKQLIYFLNDVIDYNEEAVKQLESLNSDENEIYENLWKINDYEDINNKSMNQQIEDYIKLKNMISNNELFDYSKSGDFNIETVFKKIESEYSNKTIETINDYYQLKFIYKLQKFFGLNNNNTIISEKIKSFETDCVIFKEIYERFKTVVLLNNEYFKIGGNDE